VKGTFNFTLMDYLGNSFDTVSGADGALSFTLDDDHDAVGISGTTFDDDVQVVYRASQVADSGGTTITAAPTPTASNSAATRVGMSGVLCLAVAVAAALLAAAGML
jgi:hypothetical protein